MITDHKGRLGAYLGSPEVKYQSKEGTLPTNTWTYVAVTDSGYHVRLYINGELVETGAAPKLIGTDGKLRIGGSALEAEWTYSEASYPAEEPHEVVVTGIDEAGNATSRTLQIPPPDGAIPACDPLHPGDITSTPSAVNSTPGGGTVTIYKTAGGSAYELPTPPPGFEPLSATAEELAESHRAGPGRTLQRLAAGFIAFDIPREDHWQAAHAKFTAPRIAERNPQCPSGAVSSWVGLGGFTKENPEPALLQTGVEAHVGGEYLAFTESIPRNFETSTRGFQPPSR